MDDRIFRADYFRDYLNEVADIARELKLNNRGLQELVDELVNIRFHKGRLFVLGMGGSAGNASHMVNDLRKLCGIEAYAPTDNVSEFSARVNDDSIHKVFVEWLKVSNFTEYDALFVLSVGGGSYNPPVSVPLVTAIQYAHGKMGTVLGICGRKEGYLAQKADACVVIPLVNPKRITPHSEAFQAIVWHALVSHPDLALNPTKW